MMSLASCANLEAPGASEFDNDTPPGLKGEIFGEDNRREPFEHEREVVANAEQATALLVSPEDWTRSLAYDEQTDTFAPSQQTRTLGELKQLCPGEPFANQPVLMGCTGFLVADDAILTAAHCLSHRPDCQGLTAVFGYSYPDAESVPGGIQISTSDTYTCEEVLAIGDQDGGCNTDFALIRLDRPVTGRTPLLYPRTPQLALDQALLLTGHPGGLPLKVADQGRVFTIGDRSFTTNIDVFAGNSGSPVIDPQTGKAVGMHVCSSPGDYRFDRPNNCFRPIQCGEDGDECPERATAIRVDKLSTLLDAQVGASSEDPPA